MFQKELYSDIPNVTVWRVLRKCLHLKAYKLYIVQGVQRWVLCTPLNVNGFVTLVKFGIALYISFRNALYFISGTMPEFHWTLLRRLPSDHTPKENSPVPDYLLQCRNICGQIFFAQISGRCDKFRRAWRESSGGRLTTFIPLFGRLLSLQVLRNSRALFSQRQISTTWQRCLNSRAKYSRTYHLKSVSLNFYTSQNIPLYRKYTLKWHTRPYTPN
jgi:hypothetical protein